MMGFSEVLHSITFVWLISLSIGYYKQKEEIQRNNKKCHEHSTFDDNKHKLDEPKVEDSEQFHDVDFLGQRSISGMKDVEKQSKQRNIYRHSEKNQRKLQQLPNHNNTEEEGDYDTVDDMNVASNFSTFCMLLNEEENIDTEINNNMNFTNATEFRLHLNMMTDDYPEETSWELLQHGNNEQPVIDSSFHNSTSELSNNTLHEFEYHCFVSGQDEEKEKEKEFCYDFDVKDSYGDGICCEAGFGNFMLHLNDDSTPITSERYFYGKTLSTSFCVNKSGKLIKEKEKKHTKEYPSKECINDPCICDSNPALLLAEANEDTMHDIKIQVLTQIMSLSGYENLSNVTSAQYKAACWLLNDDPYLIDHNNNTMMTKNRIERSMIQRYVLAVFYFSTKPQNWNDHYNFLTSQPECEWNDSLNSSTIYGIICNDDDSIISIQLGDNNLDGSIANELYILKSLGESKRIILSTFENELQLTFFIFTPH